MITLAATASAGWLSFRWLLNLPSLDGRDRALLYYRWGHTSGWWQFLVFLVASAASLTLLALAVVGLVALCRRLPAVVRVLVATAGTLAWLAAGAYLGISAIFLSLGTDEPVVLQAGPGDRMLLVQELVETTRYQVWVGGAGPRFVRAPEAELTRVIDIAAERCALTRQDAAHLLLRCTSRTLTVPKATAAGQG